MSFANFGIGLGALAQGLNTGMDIGSKLRKAVDQNSVRSAMTDGLASAKQKREADVAGKVQIGGTANADNTATVPTYQVDGENYADEKTARGAADKAVGSVMDYFYQNEAGKIGDVYLQQGDIEKAETWNKWIKEKNVQKGFEYGVKAYQAATAGDDKAAISHLIKMYNQPGYFEDGRTAKGYAPIKNKAGETTGYAITLKERDGTETTLNVNKGEELLQQVQMLANPQKVYEQGMADVRSARQAQLDFAKGRLDQADKLEVAQVKANTTAGLEDKKQGNRIELKTIESELGAVKPSAVEQKAAGLQKVAEQFGLEGDALKKFVMDGVGAKNDQDFTTLAIRTLSQPDMMGRNQLEQLQAKDPAAAKEKIAGLAKLYKEASVQAGGNGMAGGIPAQAAKPGQKPRAYRMDYKTNQMVPIP